jgi:hypothetical protein
VLKEKEMFRNDFGSDAQTCRDGTSNLYIGANGPAGAALFSSGIQTASDSEPYRKQYIYFEDLAFSPESCWGFILYSIITDAESGFAWCGVEGFNTAFKLQLSRFCLFGVVERWQGVKQHGMDCQLLR